MKTSIYLNFTNQTEEAFEFYKSIFGGEFIGGVMRMGDTPAYPGQPELTEADKNLIMHIQLNLPGGVALHGTDAPETMGFKLNKGNNMYIMIDPGSKESADELFAKLSIGGEVEMPMADMFWGDYFGSFKDKFGICWMINVENQSR